MALPRSLPAVAFEFSFEDDDDPDCLEYGYWDASKEVFVVKHQTAPMTDPTPIAMKVQQQAALPPLLSWMRRPMAS